MHDAFGRPLKVGDKVAIPAIITELHGGEDFCNVSLETAIGRRPDGAKERVYAINTGVMVRIPDDMPDFWVNRETGGADPAEGIDLTEGCMGDGTS